MEAEGGRDIQIRIDVVDVVKAPEKSHPMVSHVPIVECEIHQQKTECELKRRRKGHEMDKSKPRSRRPSQCPSCRRLYQASRCDECEYRNSEIHKEPRNQR